MFDLITLLWYLVFDDLHVTRLLLTEMWKENPKPSITLRPALKLELMTNDDCIVFFRFEKEALIRVKNALQLEDTYRLPNRVKFEGIEGLCILLRRMSSPGRLSDMVPMFGRSVPTLSIIFNYMVNLLYDRFSHLLRINPTTLSVQKMKILAKAVMRKEAHYRTALGSLMVQCELFVVQLKTNESAIMVINENML